MTMFEFMYMRAGLEKLVGLFALLLALCIITTYRCFNSNTNIGPAYNIAFKTQLPMRCKMHNL